MAELKLKVLNTLTREKEDFVPVNPESNSVGMYSCWPTVYGTPHIWNIRAFFSADLIRNTLKLAGYKVKSVMNITDVGHLVGDGDEGEDKLSVGAKREWLTAREVARKYEEKFLWILSEIHIEKFDVMPRATEHIQEQIDLVKTLEEKGYTYSIPEDGIYMDTSKIDDYGKLLGPKYKKHLENLRGGERVGLWEKKNITDFALRKFAKPTESGEWKREMERDSPWWIGFPWWHAECSAMSSKYLGKQFDIHHGGADHISIHHPNEIAQSECAFEVSPWVKYWLHNQFLQVDWGKMGKSLWNMYSLEDIKDKGFDALDLRYFFFMAHYRSFQDFTWENLQSAHNARINLKKKIKKHLTTTASSVWKSEWKSEWKIEWKTTILENYHSVFETLFDDFNTPKVVAEINKLLKNTTEEDLIFLQYLDDNLLKLDLFNNASNETASDTIQEIIPEEIPEEIINIAEQRKQAKSEKNYALADELRTKINNAGYEIKDNSEWYEIKPV